MIKELIFEMIDDITDVLPFWIMIFGTIIAVLGGIGFGLALAIFFIGGAIKLLTANIW